PVTFQQGELKLTGERALIYARSRHAAGSEGSDFARSQRQQIVIQAFKQKAISLNLISDIGSINSLADIFADHFHTNLEPGELYRLYDITKGFNNDQLLSLPLDPASKLICSRILETNGAYVLVPCVGKTERDIENFFLNAFTIGKLARERSTVWISDSTNR